MSDFFNDLFAGYSNQNDNNRYSMLYKDIIFEILNDESKTKLFAKKIKNIADYKKEIFINSFNDFIENSDKFSQFEYNPESNLTIDKTDPTFDEKLNYFLCENSYNRNNVAGMFFFATNSGDFSFNIECFLSELSKVSKPKKDKILKIFYDVIGDSRLKKRIDVKEDLLFLGKELLKIFADSISESYANKTENIKMFKDTLINCKKKILYVKNSSNDNNLIEECDALEKEIEKQLQNAENNIAKDIKAAINRLNNIVEQTNKLYCKSPNVKEKTDSIHQKCKDKLKEIKELSKDFEHIIKNDYHKDCDNIENKLNNCNDNPEEINKIIDEINNLYRNAYNRKHNKSSLSYVMDVEEDIDLLEHIN